MRAEKVTEMKRDIFYVGITNHASARRSMLESSKGLIQLMQRHEKLKALKSEKYAQMSKLRAIYGDIISAMDDLKAELPKVDVRSLPRKSERAAQEAATGKTAKPAGQQATHVPRRMSTIDRLEAELNDIESKLKTIS